MPPPLDQCWDIVFGSLPETKRFIFENSIKVSFGTEKIVISFPNRFALDYFEDDCLLVIKANLLSLVGREIEVVLSLSDAKEDVVKVSSPGLKDRTGLDKPVAVKEEPAYLLKPRPGNTLDKFVIGWSNREAFEAASALARGRDGFNMVLVTGPIGAGKTHLLWGANLLSREVFPRNNILLCVPAQAFIGEVTRLAREKNAAAWESYNKKYSFADWLFFDDIHQLKIGEGIQRQLKTIIENAMSRGAFMMLASKVPFTEVESALTDLELISRLRSFLVVEIKPPDLELKTAILLSKAREEPTPLDLDPELARKIAAMVTVPDIRPLEGIVKRLKQKVRCGGEIDSEYVKGSVGVNCSKKLDPEAIVGVVATFFKVTMDAIKSSSRIALIVKARHIAFYLCRQRLPEVSTMELARFFKKDHSTIIQGAATVKEDLKTNMELAKQLLTIEGKISF